MNKYQKIILQDNREYILQDLTDVEEVLLALKSSEVISESDYTNVHRSQNKGLKLLDVLLSKSDGLWFEEFCKALSTSYPWIGEKLAETFRQEADKKKEFYLHICGNVPLLPQPNVERSQYIQRLREDISCLKRHNFLVIHGMSGCGKTSLACHAVSDISLLESSLKGCVYWLSVGELKQDETAEDLRCQELQKKLCDMVGLAANPQKDLLSQLKHFFASGQNYSALLVLDNVMSSNVIRALDIGCKTMVTTHDCGVVSDVKQRCKFFPIQSGFTESESVQLLSDFVMDGKGPLPPKIKQCAINIHRVWKGQPMVIGLIGGQLAEKSEEAIRTEACWKEFEKNSAQESNGDVASRRRSLVQQQVNSVIEKTIDKLDPELRNLYEMLVVFVEDANITCEVLETLWEKNRSEVESTMSTLCRRSLALKKHHPFLKVWLYGIHAMLVAHLREKLTAEELKRRHQDLLMKYNLKCGGSFFKLPLNDNYFFTYICHHIEEAGEWDKYRDQFFTLNYLNSKLQATGPGDLLLDLHKYHKGLVGSNDNYRKPIEDIVKFVESSGWDIYKHKMDVIQCALLEPKESVVNIWATEMCSRSSFDKSLTLYFFPLNNPREKPKEIEMPVPNVKAVCIIPSTHSDGRVLIAPDDKEGFISEVDMRFRSKRRSFEVSNVSLLSLSECQDKFLSGSEDGYVKVWSLTSENTMNANTPPPSMRQRNYADFHFSELRTIPNMSRKHSACVTCASFSSDGQDIVSSSDAGDVAVWNLETDTLKQNIDVHPSPSAVSCAFISPDMVVYGCSDHRIYFCDIQSGMVKVIEETDRNLGRIINIMPISDEIRKLIVVQLRAASLWCWDDQILAHQADGGRRTVFVGLKKHLLHEEISNITCAAYAKHCLVIGTSQRGCCFFKMNEDFQKKQPLWIGSGMIKAVDLSHDRLVYSTGQSVRMCWPEMGSSFSNPNQDCTVCLGWDNRNVSICASTSRNKKILVYRDGKLINDRLVSKDLSILCVSFDGNHLVAGCCDGSVYFFDLVANRLELSTSLPAKVTYLQFKILNNESVYVAAADPICSNDIGLETKEESFIQVINERSHLSLKCPGLSSRLVESFTHSSLLIAVLCDYSLLVWNLNHHKESYFRPLAHSILQEGRRTAQVTGASISPDCKTLVLSDEEKCFHVFFIDWPEVSRKNEVQCNIIPRLKSSGLRLNISPPSIYISHQSLSSSSSFGSVHNGSFDETDGGVISTISMLPVTSMKTYELPAPAWCCDVSRDGDLIALGCGVNKVLIWDAAKKMEVVRFDVLPNSHSKVSHLKFSPKGITLAKKSYNTVLLVVSDCFSLWDLSYLMSTNDCTTSPTLLGCVKSGGLPFVDVSVSSTFSKFAGVDSSGTYFLWEVKE